MSTLAPHDNILRATRYEIDDQVGALVMELCDADLLESISKARRLSQDVAAPLFRQLLLAVQHMHKHNMYHCDLKPENVLLSGSTVKLTDFGASAIGTTFTARNLGSAQYLCPELLTWREGQEVGLAAGDVWSLGVVFFTMLAGYQPWSQPTMSDIHFSQFVAGTMRFPTSMSPEAVDMIIAMLALDPAERPTVSELLEWPLVAHVEAEAASTEKRTGHGVDDAPCGAGGGMEDCRASDVERYASGESKDSAGSAPKTPPRAPRMHSDKPGVAVPSRRQPRAFEFGQAATAAAGSGLAGFHTAEEVDDDVDMSDCEGYCAVSPHPRKVTGNTTTIAVDHNMTVA